MAKTNREKEITKCVPSVGQDDLPLPDSQLIINILDLNNEISDKFNQNLHKLLLK